MVKKLFDWFIGRDHELEMHRLRLQTELEMARETRASTQLIFDKLNETVLNSQEGLKAVANASAAQSNSLGEWIKMFQNQPTPTTSVVREEDEWATEMQRMKKELGLEASEVTPEIELALRLRAMED